MCADHVFNVKLCAPAFSIIIGAYVAFAVFSCDHVCLGRRLLRLLLGETTCVLYIIINVAIIQVHTVVQSSHNVHGIDRREQCYDGCCHQLSFL